MSNVNISPNPSITEKMSPDNFDKSYIEEIRTLFILD